MKVIKTSIPDVKIIEPSVFGDDRGFFMETWNKQHFEAAIGYAVNFVQDNHSKSSKGVLRGLHYQLAPHAQGKLVRCISGEVFDVVVDIRKTSSTFGQWVGIHLSEQNKRQLWVPEGFAHGFVTLSEKAEFLYKTSNYYCAESERGIKWNDEQLKVLWPVENLVLKLSDKDKIQPSFKDAEYF